MIIGNVFFVFYYRSRIRIVLSEQCGDGKSLYARRLKDKLQEMLFQKKVDPTSVIPIITVPLHGPNVTPEDVLDILFQQIECNQAKIDTKSTLKHVRNFTYILSMYDNYKLFHCRLKITTSPA